MVILLGPVHVWPAEPGFGSRTRSGGDLPGGGVLAEGGNQGEVWPPGISPISFLGRSVFASDFIVSGGYRGRGFVFGVARL